MRVMVGTEQGQRGAVRTCLGSPTALGHLTAVWARAASLVGPSDKE